MKTHPLLPTLAQLIRRADCAFTAFLAGHGKDGDGHPLPYIDEDVRAAIKACVKAGHIALAIESDELPALIHKEANEG